MKLETDRIKALCFDVDGTLSDTDDQFVEKLATWLHPFRFLFPEDGTLPAARRLVMLTETPGNFLYGIPDQLGIDDEIATLGDAIYRWGLGRGKKPFKLIPGVKEMLLQLHGRYPMAVVSARGGRSTIWFLEQFELTPLFETIVTAQTCEHTKPYPDPIQWAAKQMHVTPEECLMIGDTTVDIRAAKDAGAQSVGVLCGFGEEDELRQAGADFILKSTKLLTTLF